MLGFFESMNASLKDIHVRYFTSFFFLFNTLCSPTSEDDFTNIFYGHSRIIRIKFFYSHFLTLKYFFILLFLHNIDYISLQLRKYFSCNKFSMSYALVIRQVIFKFMKVFYFIWEVKNYFSMSQLSIRGR